MAKILIVGPASPLRGGIADLNEAFAHSLIKKGHEVEIVSFYLQYPKILFPGKTQFRKNPDKEFSFTIKSLISTINPFSWLKTIKYICNYNPDKVFIRFWMPFFAPCLGFIAKRLKKRNIPVFSIVDNAIPHEKRIGDITLVKYFLNQCLLNFTLSSAVKKNIDELDENYRTKVMFHPIYDTYDPMPKRVDALSKLQLEDEMYLLFFGLIRTYKGLDLALEAMSHPKIKEKGIKLIIAGEFYDNQEKYNLLIKELQLDNIIIFDHFIPKDEVPFFFSIADAVLLPYITATQSGVTQLALNYNTPMIVTNVGGLPEVVDNEVDGYICEPNSSKLAEAILNYYLESNNPEMMSNALMMKKKKYSWDNFTDQILNYS